MLKKLLKFELRSLSRTVIPLLLAVLGMSVLSSLLMSVNLRFLDKNGSVTLSIFSVIIGIMMVFTFLAIIASSFIILLLILQRFYKNFFTDEGYLTFTLPVTTAEHLTVKVMSGFIWIIISTLSISVSLFIFALFGTATGPDIINTQVLEALAESIRTLLKETGAVNLFVLVFEFLLLGIISIVAQLLTYYLAITIGSIIAKKHKILSSIGVYFIINMIVGILSNVIIVLVTIPMETSNAIYKAQFISHIYLTVMIVLFAITSVVSFMICNHMLKNKLNID